MHAASACVRGGGMEPASVDMAGALAMASALGCEAEIAAELLAACAAGMHEGQRKRKETT